MILYLFLDYADAYEPVGAAGRGHQSLHRTLAEAEAHRQTVTCDGYTVFELDTDAMTSRVVVVDGAPPKWVLP